MSDSVILSFQRLRAITSRPMSIGIASCVAVAWGAISPLMNLLLLRICPARAVPLASAALMMLSLVLIYRMTDRAKFRTDWRARIVTLLSGSAWITGVVGLVWCYSQHICMAGHMDHPPYPSWHYAADIGWVLCLAGSAVWTCLELAPISLAFAAINSFLVSHRFLFGSFGGLYYPLPL